MSDPAEQRDLGEVPAKPSWSPAKQTILGLGAMVVVLVVIVAIALVSGSNRNLRADILSGRADEPGNAAPITVSIRDTAGELELVTVDFGDGTEVRPVEAVASPTCVAEPFSHDVDLTHVYEQPGVYTIRTRVVTGGCGARTERVDAERTIEIKVLRR